MTQIEFIRNYPGFKASWNPR